MLLLNVDQQYSTLADIFNKVKKTWFKKVFVVMSTIKCDLLDTSILYISVKYCRAL